MFDWMPPGVEALLTFQLILLIAALGHWLPLSINQLDIAVPAYMAIGAYTSAVLTSPEHNLPFVPAMVVGGALAAVAALGVDYIASRVRATGFAFAVFSLGFFEVLQVVLNNVKAVGGAGGFRIGVPATTLELVLAVLAAALLFVGLLKTSYLGRAMNAIRDDEQAAEAMGINVLATKLLVFGSGAMLGGFAGALYAHYALYIVPSQFGFEQLVAIQLPVVLGGLQTVLGPIFGILFVGVVTNSTRDLAQYRLIFTAALTLAVILLRPSGAITSANVKWVLALVWRLRPRRMRGPENLPAQS